MTLRPTEPSWSPKQRAVKSIQFGLIIFSTALLLGTLGFRLVRYWGWFPPFDFRQLVMAAVGQNQELVSLWQQSLTPEPCTNPTKGFSLTAAAPLVITSTQNLEDKCTELINPKADEAGSYLKIISHGRMTADDVRQYYLDTMDQVTTDIYTHPFTTGTIINGSLDQIQTNIIILPFAGNTLAVVQYPAQKLLDQSENLTIASLRSLPPQ